MTSNSQKLELLQIRSRKGLGAKYTQHEKMYKQPKDVNSNITLNIE